MFDLKEFRDLLKVNAPKAFESIINVELSEKDVKDIAHCNQDILNKYFGQCTAIQKLTQFFFDSKEEETIKAIKAKRSFLVKEHAEAFSSNELKDKTKPFLFWNGIYKEAQKKVQHFDDYLKAISLEKLICQLAVVYEFDRAIRPTLLYDNPDTIQVFNEIIKRKAELKNFGGFSKSVDSFDRLFRKTLSQLKNKTFKWKKVKKLYLAYDNMENVKFPLEIYLNNDSEIEFESTTKLKLIPKDPNFKKVWKMNDKKTVFRNHYYDEILEMLNKNGVTPLGKSLFKYNMHGLPDKVELGEGKIVKVNSYLQTLATLGEDCNRWNLLIDMFHTKTRLKYEHEFFGLMEEWCVNSQPIVPFSFEHLSHKEVIESQESFAIMDWASIDFNKSDVQTDLELSETPFMKCGDNYIAWCGVLSNKNFGDILATRIRKLGDKNEYGSAFENKVIELFDQNEFKTYSAKFRKRKGAKRGEFDLLAYKDGVVFLLEMKSTYGRAYIDEIAHHEANAIQKAKKQVEKDYIELMDDFEYLQKELSIKESFDELEIYPLITANNFEHEEVLYPSEIFENGIRKVSDFELELILKDSYCIMINEPDKLLWRKREPHCSSSTLKNAIDNRVIWSDLIKVMEKEKFETNRFELGEFGIEF
jgi:Holliday junction resolvase-like predicted endonuclease